MTTNRTVPLGTIAGIVGTLEVDQRSQALAVHIDSPFAVSVKIGRRDGAGPTTERHIEAGSSRVELDTPVPVTLLDDGRVKGLLVEMKKLTESPRA